MSSAPYPITPLDAALLYGVMGWRVAPVRPESKVPAINDWPTRASSNADTIGGWWSGTEYASCGVCIVTGRASGLWVLDVDVSSGKPGIKTLKALLADHGDGALPETLVARTPAGGYHYYWIYPEGAEVHNSASNRLGPGLDVRGEGGQVNAPPTTRGDDCYRWATERGPYDAVVSEAPAWLLDLVMDQTPPIAAPPKPSLRLIAEANKHLTDAPSYVTRYNEEHSWDEILLRDGWTLSHADREGVRYWTRPGKDEREGISASVGYAGTDMLYVWTTALDWLPAERGYDRFGYMVHRDFGGDFRAAGQSLARRESQGGVSVAGLVSVNQTNPNVAPAGATDPLESILDDDSERTRYELLKVDFDPNGPFWNADLNDADFLIEPLIARGRGHALYAGAKTGKSYIVLHAIAAACIPGHKSWVTTLADDPVSIVYLDYEMTEADLRERLEMFGYGPKDDYSHLHYIKAGALGADLDTYEGGQDLTNQAKAWGAQLVIVDTLSRAVRGEENDADTIRDFYRFTGTPLKANGIAVLRLDHAGKEAERGQRGTSGKNDDVDVVWRLDRTDDGAKLTNTHSRVFWMPSEITLRYEEDADGVHNFTQVQESQTYTSGTAERADKWLALGIPLNASRRQARDAGFSCKNDEYASVKRYLRLNSLGKIDDLIGGPR